MLSYAQNFEDVMLNRIFSDKKDGFYIDIGAWDPVLDSVTKHFYDQGWNGINVEPIQEKFNLFTEQRNNDINVNLAISSQNGDIDFFEMDGMDALSTTKAELIDHFKSCGFDIRKTNKVKAITLEELCSQYVGDKTIDFLKIDVEGAEFDVLKGGNWTNYRPIALIIEATKPFTPIPCWDEWENFVFDNGYVFAHFDSLNRFYIREEDKHLVERFKLPPNLMDGFVVYRDYMTGVNAGIKAVRDELAQKEQHKPKQSTISSLVGTLKTLVK